VTWSPGIWEPLVTRNVTTRSSPALGWSGLAVRVAVSFRPVASTRSHETSSMARKPTESR